MDDWVKLATERHQMFEEQLKIKSHQRLDLSEYLNGALLKVKKTKDKDIVMELQELKNLYDEGVLTEEEFKKAKKNVLDQ